MASADSARPQRIRLRLRAIVPRAPARGPTSQRARGQAGSPVTRTSRTGCPALTASPLARAWQKVFTVQGTVPRDAAFTQTPCADEQGFSLHVAVRCDADNRKRLEQPWRYITRPALANERVQCNAAGPVVHKLKTAWRDGSTHLVMSLVELMPQLAAPVPQVRLHLPVPWRAGAVLYQSGQAAGHGGAGRARRGRRRVGACSNRVRLLARFEEPVPNARCAATAVRQLAWNSGASARRLRA